jgi:hypothetical protein
LVGLDNLERHDVGRCERTMASDRAKPTAKSSRSEGVAIITACVVPPKDSATGTSSGKARIRAWQPLP